MSKKRKNRIKKALGAALALAGIGAVMNRGAKARQMKDFLATEGGDPASVDQIGNAIKLRDANTAVLAPGNDAFDYFTNQDIMQGLKKGGRVGYGKGGKVSRGCGKVMAGRNKKTKYI